MASVPPIKDIPVVILCGGKGIRIREVSELVPKPMLRIGDQPILWHIMMIYAAHGFRRFILCLGYMGDQIKEYFLNYHAMTRDVTLHFNGDGSPPRIEYHRHPTFNPDWSVTLANTGLNTLTGGRVARLAEYLDQDLFMLTYGDGLGDVNLRASLEHHRTHGALVTVTGVRPSSRFGLIGVDGDRIVSFAEKPQIHEGYISGGFMVCQRSFVTDYLSPAADCVLETDGLARVAEDGGMVVFRHDGFWMPMDNSNEYNALNDLWEKGQAPWRIW